MRTPAVCGSFYPSSASRIRKDVEGYLEKAKPQVARKERLAIVCPHAGYVYSGAAAAYSYASCANFSRLGITAIIIGPNHTGMGAPVSVSFDDWKTPLGEMKCDSALAEAIVKSGKIAQRDEKAHLQEHSCEVQLPFLQMAAKEARIVCVCMGWQDAESARDLGSAIFAAVKKTGRDAIVIASSDFTHHESAASAKEKDTQAIELLRALDCEGFETLVDTRNLSICGHGPIAAALSYSLLSGAKKCELLKYTNSGAATGDESEVVAYAALAMGK
jgi:MEMO1 family protein